MNREYYQKHRAAILRRTRERHERDQASPVYRNLCRARRQCSNIRDSIQVFKKRLEKLKRKLKRQERLTAELALWWGEERAKRKRATV